MRVDKLRQVILGNELDGMLISNPLSRRYLSGFSGTAGWLLVSADRAMLAVDFRYYERAERESPGWEQMHVTRTYPDILVEMVARADIKVLGIESDHVTLAQLDEMARKVPEVTFMPLENVVLQMRAVKDEHEIDAIARAVACSDDAFAHLCQVIRPGMTEVEVAWELESHMRLHGASATSFESIVGSGPNGAMPHATAGDRVIREGEPIVLDFGALVNGYCSDITRTISLGHGDDRYERTWRLVLEAQRAVEEQLRPGMNGKEADAIARDTFARAGHADRFGHGLGHGVGLAIHENPRMGRLAEDAILEPGMVLTVEPGLYYPGWGGVRIEDVVVVRDDGVQVLTQAAKEPVLIVQAAR
ncbi:MAG: aminopeptidase P family protein [Anaerolineae bacterium]|nr:aminopeptidase P family protein [Anaerolineae bacterium]